MKAVFGKIKNKKVLLALFVALLAMLIVITVAVVHIFNTHDLPEFNGSETSISDIKIDLGNGLSVTSIGNYTGVFFEDGSDDVVSNILMIVLRNDSQQDLQLARINILYEDYTAEFEATNIPVGKSVVLLEKNRKPFKNHEYISASLSNVAFFDSPMSLQPGTFSLIGGDGFLEIKNISEKNLEGTTYVYYKNVADDVLYGGITYRAVVEEAIPAGKSVRVLTQHYTLNNTEVMQVLNVN